jgi:hypothetical protein
MACAMDTVLMTFFFCGIKKYFLIRQSGGILCPWQIFCNTLKMVNMLWQENFG